MSRFPCRRRTGLRFTVAGAGSGGLAMAGHLALLGEAVSLFNRNPGRLAPIQESGGVHLEGALEGFGRLEVISSDPAQTIPEADVIMVVVPASGHREMALTLAPHLRDGQILVLHPGRTLGAVECEHVLRRAGCFADVTVAEAQTLLYASRLIAPDRVRVFRVKHEVPVAALPAWRTADVLRVIRRVLPQFEAAPHVFKTGLDNIGAVFHPGPALLNLARIENEEPFEYYVEGITPAAAAVLEAVDAERLAVARALGVRAVGAREWLAKAYRVGGKNLHAAIHANPAYRGIPAPAGLDTRYLWEDVPTGLVPLASLGEFLEVPTPAINSLITLASLAVGVDFRATGRTLERAGLAGMSLDDIRAFVTQGRERACKLA